MGELLGAMWGECTGMWDLAPILTLSRDTELPGSWMGGTTSTWGTTRTTCTLKWTHTVHSRSQCKYAVHRSTYTHCQAPMHIQEQTRCCSLLLFRLFSRWAVLSLSFQVFAIGKWRQCLVWRLQGKWRLMCALMGPHVPDVREYNYHMGGDQLKTSHYVTLHAFGHLETVNTKLTLYHRCYDRLVGWYSSCLHVLHKLRNIIWQVA